MKGSCSAGGNGTGIEDLSLFPGQLEEMIVPGEGDFLSRRPFEGFPGPFFPSIFYARGEDCLFPGSMKNIS